MKTHNQTIQFQNHYPERTDFWGTGLTTELLKVLLERLALLFSIRRTPGPSFEMNSVLLTDSEIPMIFT